MPQLRRILFVDDDPSVLHGLKRMLRKTRGEWETEFAESGPAALALMAENPVEVIVSDMRMPGMDGAALLKEIKTRYPDVVRFVLSGQSDSELILRSAAVAHQYLAKPCSVEMLMNALTRSDNLRALFDNSHLKSVVSGISTLPVLPEVYSQLVDMLSGNDCTPKNVGEVISHDVGMTAKMLQLINSAFFGMRRTVEDPAQAAFYIGLDAVRGLVLSIGAFAQFQQEEVEEFLIESLHQHCLRTGSLAKTVVCELGGSKDIQDFALTAGAIHDIGMLLLFRESPTDVTEIHRLYTNETMPLAQAEREVLGVTHGELGGYLLGLWGLQDAVVEAVAFHDDPQRSPSEEITPLAAVHIAEGIENEGENFTSFLDATHLDMEYLERLNVLDKIDDFRARHRSALREHEESYAECQ
jgi:HD-like signal output (HDOD) protein